MLETMTESQKLDYVLVQMKDQLIERIDSISDMEKSSAKIARINEIRFCLDSIRPIWKALSYEYK